MQTLSLMFSLYYYDPDQRDPLPMTALMNVGAST